MPRAFLRAGFTQLEIGIAASEELGFIDGAAYIEDAHGLDNHATLYHVGTGWEMAILMLERPPDETTPHTVFSALVDFDDLTVGVTYGLKGFVTDGDTILDLSTLTSLQFVVVTQISRIIVHPSVIVVVKQASAILVRIVQPASFVARWVEVQTGVTRFLDASGLVTLSGFDLTV